jgi:hypothetical protein
MHDQRSRFIVISLCGHEAEVWAFSEENARFWYKELYPDNVIDSVLDYGR